MSGRLAAVVLNYRTPRETLLAVESLEASSRQPDDVIVIDNGSNDGSVERLRALPSRATLLALPVNVGFSEGNNVGIREALRRGATRVVLVNSDAAVTPNC